ncbi:MAG: phosphate propanoyltransferase [Candidatus Latescibacteria bacterium]|nr:phosphate propanoyltransferase [Candidatus Latescibacterota bacterium]
MRPAPRLVVNISARHAHVGPQALAILFGEGAELTVQKPLYQEGAFASEQEVAIFGPRRQTISNLRILGPLRDTCQVELSFTDARFLGIDAPVRLSGDHRDTPGCYLVGPAGGLQLSEGVIRAARHAHMNPQEAASYGVSDGSRMRLAVESEQGGSLDNIICRVGERDKLEVHLDTDEGNAVDLVRARRAYLESQ